MYHKQGARNSVFAVNRSLRSLETGLRFLFGHFSRMVIEVSFLGLALGSQCGAIYMLNLLLTFVVYCQFTREVSSQRLLIVRDQKNLNKSQEFFMNESIVNYEAVKAFNNEALELRRYNKLVCKIKNQANKI